MGNMGVFIGMDPSFFMALKKMRFCNAFALKLAFAWRWVNLPRLKS